MSAATKFTLYNPETGRVFGGLGTPGCSGVAAEKWYAMAERRATRWGLVFDETCPHNDAVSQCRRSGCEDGAA